MASTPTLYLDIWSDFVCPFCYLEMPVIDQFRNAYGDAVAVRWHAFELRPDPTPLLEADDDVMMASWETSVYPLADERNLVMRLPEVHPRSRLAQEAALFARDAGLFEMVQHALFKAYFEDGLDIGDQDTVIDIAASCGADPGMLEEALENGTYTAAVQEDQAFAAQLGASSLPFIVMSRDPAVGQDMPPAPIALRGAAPVQHFEAAVERLFPDGFPEG
jgi:predicted DsbA family dithiol-disulfide isomerase